WYFVKLANQGTDIDTLLAASQPKRQHKTPDPQPVEQTKPSTKPSTNTNTNTNTKSSPNTPAQAVIQPQPATTTQKVSEGNQGKGVQNKPDLIVRPKVINNTTNAEKPVITTQAGNTSVKPTLTESTKPFVQAQVRPPKTDPAQSSSRQSNSPKVSKMQVKPVSLTAAQRSEKKYQAAKKLTNQGMIKQAVEQYNSLLQISGDHTQARMALAALYFGREKVANALNVLDQGLAIDANNISLALLAAKIHYKHKSYQAALNYLQLTVTTAEQIEYVALKATTLQQTRQYGAAVTEFERLIGVNPANGRWWLGLGSSLEALGDKPAAINAYQKSLASSQVSAASRQFIRSRLSELKP
ncbi:MAG: MSHA biogenesis protein MshN, partial [Alteromonadaceae bacterium]